MLVVVVLLWNISKITGMRLTELGTRWMILYFFSPSLRGYLFVLGDALWSLLHLVWITHQ